LTVAFNLLPFAHISMELVMFWIFAAVVVTLAVYNRGFRKVLLWGIPLWLIILIATGRS